MSTKETDTTIPPILRAIFPLLSDIELREAEDRLIAFFRSMYIRYQDEIEEALVRGTLDRINPCDTV